MWLKVGQRLTGILEGFINSKMCGLNPEGEEESLEDLNGVKCGAVVRPEQNDAHKTQHSVGTKSPPAQGQGLSSSSSPLTFLLLVLPTLVKRRTFCPVLQREA